MSNMGCIYGTLSWLISLNIKYKRICEDPERKATTIYFGVYSMIVSLFCAGLILLCSWGALALYSGIENSGISEILMWLFIAMLIICIIVLVAELILGGLMGIVYQYRCNDHPIRYIATAVFAVIIAALVAGLIFVL